MVEGRGNSRVRLVCLLVPVVILWFLWKKRNTIVNGGVYSMGKIIWSINNIILKVIMCRFKVGITVNRWAHNLGVLKGYKDEYGITVVRWKKPPINWFKCNTNGFSKGNPRPSSATFCIRDHQGNLVVAKGPEREMGGPVECEFGGDVQINQFQDIPSEVRRRMMMTSGEAVKYKSSLDAFTQIVMNEGPKSLFKGLVLTSVDIRAEYVSWRQHKYLSEEGATDD
ncbi:hypothetical protein HAX54_048858 [Datura stramonium]|uniref:ADP/ATP translocase n=1 Tax=Datura stramonium TaxID=4076 RepID=A0ABS8WJR4_DATST|nr:hypothetical protein [Datura stramonium]